MRNAQGQEVTAQTVGQDALIAGGFGLAARGAGYLVNRFTPSGVVAGNGSIFNPAGLERALKYNHLQQTVSLNETIGRIAGTKPVISYTQSGKTIYTNPRNGQQVVYDNAGNYFRVENTNVTGPLRYLDQFGKAIPANVPLVKPTGTSQTGVPSDVRRALTHFTNGD